MQLPFAAFAVQKAWTPPTPEQWPQFGRVKGSNVVFDVESKDEDIHDLGPGCLRDDSYVAGVGIGIDGGPKQYIPLRHKGGDNIENPDAFWAWFADQARETECTGLGANIAYELKWFKGRHKIQFPKVKRWYDVLGMDTLCYELHPRGDLDAVAHRRGIPGKNKELLIKACKDYGLKKPLAEMWKLPARYVVDYNISDLEAPLRLFPMLLAELTEMQCLELLDIETRLTPYLVDMYLRGVRINTEKLTRMEMWYRTEEMAALREIKRITGAELSLGQCGNNSVVGPLLEATTGIVLPRSKKKEEGRPQIILDEAILANNEETHELFKWVHRARKLDTARGFCPGTWDHLIKGRLHCSYNQFRATDKTLSDDYEKEQKTKGTKTGRMSCEHPNLTQVPSRDPWSKNWRSIFEPEDGMQWWSADYSQQEPRLTTSDAAFLNLPKARETSNAYLTDELLDNHAFMAQLTGLPRKKAKNIYLGLVYSMGEAKLCRQLGLPTQYCVAVGPYREREEYFFDNEDAAVAFRKACTEEQVAVFECAGKEGKQILNTFHTRAPFLKELSDFFKKRGLKYGVIRTILNRHLHLPMDPKTGKYGEVHACLNKRIQGSAADMVKLAMVTVMEQMPDLFMQLQVHDQIAGSTELGKLGRERAKHVGRIMRNAWKDKYMLYRVDVAAGPSWGEEWDMCFNQFCIIDGKDSDHKYCPEHAPRMAT